VDESFESRVWGRALARGLISSAQINQCLKEAAASAPTLQLTEVLVRKGMLDADQVTEIRGEIAAADPGTPDEVRRSAREPRNLVGRYVLTGELGRGGMGVVYKAWDGDLRRSVALKVLTGPSGEEDLARFRREAQSAAALRHPNIVTVYEIGTSDESPFIAMELIDGHTLDGRKLPSRKAAELMIVIARAVDAAHQKGIIHRDLKPHNIMIDAEGGLRVMDFGLAKPVQSSTQITVDGTVLGTPAYMSPEQAQGRADEVGPRSDIFSLGALLYELLTGQAPFKGRTPLETLTAVVHRDPVPPRRLAPSVPRPLETIILTCLHKERMKRYGSAEALARDLERFLKGEPIVARLPRKRAPLVLAATAGVVLLAGVIVLLGRSPAPAPTPPPAPVAAPPVVNRSALDRGLRLLDEAKLDLYRGGVSLTRIQSTLEEAERNLSEALKVDPNSGAAWLGRGETRSRLNRPDAALDDLTEAVRRLATSPAAFLARGRLLLERFMEEMTTAAWLKGDLPDEILRRRDQARQDFLKARELAASKNDLPYLEACLAFAEEQYQRAIDLATSALAEAEHPEEFHKLRGDAAATLAADENRPGPRAELRRKSLEDYTQALRLRANYPAAFRARGALLWYLGRPDEAFADFQAVLAMDPRDSRALSDIGTYHQRKGQNMLALDFFDRALASDAKNYRALTNRAALYLEQAKVAEARQDLEAALLANPRHLAAQFNLAGALYRLGERTAALKRLDDLLVRVPNFTRARYTRGVIYFEGKQWKEALDDFEKSVSADPSLAPQLRSSIDECRRQLGR
jgi:tetratricopeptide (TPR) repeat protein